MAIKEYKEFVKDGNQFFKYEIMIASATNMHSCVSYVIYAKNLNEATKLSNNCYEVYIEPCCYLYTDSRGHKRFNLCNNGKFSFLVSSISRASECEIRELYKHLKYDNKGI